MLPAPMRKLYQRMVAMMPETLEDLPRSVVPQRPTASTWRLRLHVGLKGFAFSYEAPFCTVEDLSCLMPSSADGPFSCTNLTDSDSLFRRFTSAMASFRCRWNWIAKKKVVRQITTEHLKWIQKVDFRDNTQRDISVFSLLWELSSVICFIHIEQTS